MFARGERPDAAAIFQLVQGQPGFAISFDPLAGKGNPEATPDEARGMDAGTGRWLELLVNGLTFDLSGLAAGPSSPPPPKAHGFGLPADMAAESLEAISLRPGPHLAGGGAMLPVVRSLALLAAQLALLPGVRAVAWHPARCWSAPQQFRTSVLNWMEGGAFPVFSLAALAPTLEGGMQSEGLALFTGQELRLEPELTEDRANGGKIAVRLLHWLAEHGRLSEPKALASHDGQPLRLEPSVNHRFVRVWKA